jgi:hypothetical protein
MWPRIGSMAPRQPFELFGHAALLAAAIGAKFVRGGAIVALIAVIGEDTAERHRLSSKIRRLSVTEAIGIVDNSTMVSASLALARLFSRTR